MDPQLGLLLHFPLEAAQVEAAQVEAAQACEPRSPGVLLLIIPSPLG